MSAADHAALRLRIQELFNYDPATGLFTWKILHGGRKRIPAGSRAGTVSVQGAVVIRFDGKLHYAHRLAWLYAYGEMPTEIDHKDGDPQNNRLDNLRPCLHAENCRNQRKSFNGFTSQYKGVCWNRSKGLWQADIQVDGRRKFLGRFRTEAEAAAVYDEAAMANHGEFARLNFPIIHMKG